jgi:hypothetical protein
LDHQLFVLALVAVYTISDLKKILILVTAFTIGHSITLALSTLGLLQIPSAWVEFLIPLTIAITALDNIFMKNNPNKLMKLNYYLALLFGLIHGLGFANTARMMLAKEQSIFLPLLGFNTGLELGQILVVVIFLVVIFIVLQVFRINKKDWILFVSSGVFALALQMALERTPPF